MSSFLLHSSTFTKNKRVKGKNWKTESPRRALSLPQNMQGSTFGKRISGRGVRILGSYSNSESPRRALSLPQNLQGSTSGKRISGGGGQDLRILFKLCSPKIPAQPWRTLRETFRDLHSSYWTPTWNLQGPTGGLAYGIPKYAQNGVPLRDCSRTPVAFPCDNVTVWAATRADFTKIAKKHDKPYRGPIVLRPTNDRESPKIPIFSSTTVGRPSFTGDENSSATDESKNGRFLWLEK